MEKNNILLIQLWLGKIPDYFWYHYETTKNLIGFNFILFTDQEIELDSKNYTVINTTKEDIELKLSGKLNYEIKIKNNKKTCDLKASFGDLFEEYFNGYDYFGCYDIDTLFGDVYRHILPYMDKYDFITIGEETFHNRLSGPFLIMRNTKDIRTLYKKGDFIKCMSNNEVECYEEHTLSDLAKEDYKIKIVNSMNCETNNGGKNTYDVHWSGGKLIINGEEKIFYHFYRKNHTIFQKVGNQIFGRYDKKFVEDFYWVFGFTENYSQTIPYLMDSINKYSNRKCVIYSINFDYNISNKFLTSGQFIFKRIDIEPGKKDSRGRDENIISCKPRLMLDVINFLPNKKFIFIDSDVYLTTSSDDFGRYFNNLENYPLINQHTHDKLYLCNIVEGEEWTSTVDILADATNTEITVFPRRKTNVMLFDEDSKWFFQEQLKMYDEYKDSRPGIFTLHDEDSANVILSKYDLHKSLHLCDIEESSNINMSKFTDMNHPFHMTGLSDYLILPNHQNDVFCFHGLKHEWQYKNIQNDYGNSVIDCEEILVTYKDNTISFEKNSFLTTKKIEENVDFIIKTIDGQVVSTLPNQNLFQYWLFYISGVELISGCYLIEIFKTESRVKIYNNLLVVNNVDNRIILEPEVRIPFFVLLHQLGQNETELLYLKDKLPKNSLLLSIRGPRDWKTERDDGYGWFDILGNQLHNFSKEDDIEMCSNYINTIIEETVQKYPLLDDPIFIGASQGGVVALHACVDHKIKCKAVVSLLGFYEFKLNNNQLSNIPILMINGELDNVIPYDWVEISKTHLKPKNKNVTDIFLKSGHQITEEMIDISMLWIHKLL